MAILKDVKKYWDDEKCADFSYNYFMKTAPELKQDLLNYGVEIDGASVLDLGCGIGRIPLIYKPKRYVGVDQSSIMLGRAREMLADRPEVELVESTLYSFKTDEHFDVALLIDVLPHLDERGCISEYKRFLRNDADVYIARLFISVTGETIHYNSDTWGYLSISYTPEYIEQELLPLAKDYGAEAFLMRANHTSPSIVNGYIIAYKD